MSNLLKIALVIPALWLSAAPVVLAQSITAAPDGTGTVIQHNGNTYHIEGGTQAGANLFHSFQKFGLSPGEIANFLSNPTVTNVLARVVGGDPSIINGLIEVTGANSNLYLMNPAGIVFGSGASLNIGGDFVATTADRIGFEGGWFNASGTNDYATLVGAPNQFAFLSENPSAVLNFGTLQNTQDVTLAAGTVLNQGEIISTAGKVTIAAVPGTRLVKLSQPEMLLSLEVPAEAIAAGIAPKDLASLLTGAGDAATVVEAGDVVLDGVVQGQQVDLFAAGNVTPTDVSFVKGDGDVRVTRFTAEGKNPTQALFIDRRADNPEVLLYGAEAGTVSQIIERDENGIETISSQLTAISESMGELDSVAIVAEGNKGNFWLGNQWIRSENIGDYVEPLAQWGEALTAGADLLLYSCFTALGATGEALVASIADMTGADVAASVDVTGSGNYGGDWDLEHQVGSIESGNPFMSTTLGSWEGKLAVRTVQNLNDTGSGSLRDALTGTGGTGSYWSTAVADGDEIDFAVTGQIDIGAEIDWTANNLTLDGPGQNDLILDGGGVGRIFNISANTANLKKLTIQKGSANIGNQGGGINYTGNGTLALDRVSLIDNSANGRGGAISSLAGNILVKNSLFKDNKSIFSGGSIAINSGNITILDSQFLTNDSQGNGGAIAVFMGDIVASQTKFSGNSSRYTGGAIHVELGALQIRDSEIIQNTASTSGGGVASKGGTITIKNSHLYGNTSYNWGGGVFGDSQVQVYIDKSTLSQNYSEYGGGAATLDGTLTIQDSLVFENNALWNGGGIYSQSDISAIETVISRNQVSLGNGEGLYSESGQVSVGGKNLEISDAIFSRSTEEAINLEGTNIRILTPIQSGGGKVSIKASNIFLSAPIESDGGNIFLEASNELTAFTSDATLNSSSNTSAGHITIRAAINQLKNLVAVGFNGNGGDVKITSTGGLANTTFGGGQGLINTSGNNGSAGDVSVVANSEIIIGQIFAESIGGQGGQINLESAKFVRLTGVGSGFFGGQPATISAIGSKASGSIRIQHGGLGIVPFTVGDASINGSAGRLITGNAPHQIIEPTQLFLRNYHQGSIVLDAGLPNAGTQTILPEIIQGSNPPLPPLYGKTLIEILGKQLSAEVLLNIETGEFAFDLPNEVFNLTGVIDVPFPDLTRITAVDEILENDYENHLGEELTEDTEVVNLANIRQMLSKIEGQTGTRPVLVYALSHTEGLELIMIQNQDIPVIHKVIPEANKSTIHRTVRSFENAIQSPQSDRYLEPSQQLYNWLIAPIQDELQAYNVDTLLFAMSDGLRALPLAALHDGEQFLVEQYSLGMIPSVSLTNSNYQPLHESQVVAMGASEFQAQPALPAVPVELAMITQNQTAQPWLNADFTLDNLRDQSRNRDYDIVHLATHAAFPVGRGDRAYIQFWEDKVRFQDLRTLGWHNDPQVELLVLSACQTALGDAHAELGFAGLAVQTGVKSALASLWRVNDLGTVALMDGFYDHLRDPAITIKAEALRQAQLDLINGEQIIQDGQLGVISLPPELAQFNGLDMSHPYYWSGFTLVGSPW